MTAPSTVIGAEPEVEALRRELLDLKQRTEQLERKLQAIEASPKTTTNLPSAAIAGTNTSPSVSASSSAEAKWSPADPIRIGTAQNYINISFDGLFAAGTSTASDIESLQPGGHDPIQRGFTVQGLETTLEGKIDPYLRGQGNIVLQIDTEGETIVEAEEAFLETLSLPWNLQLRAGQFFTDFGRHNPTHAHTWDFVDLPLVNTRFFGGESLRSAGARLSWLVPTPFYSELFLTVANSVGETAFSFRNDHEGEAFTGRLADERSVQSFNDLLFVPRYAASFDLTDSQTLLAGASAAFGPNSTGSDSFTQIYGVDLFWKWKSPNHHGGFPFVTWQSEAMMRRFEAGIFDWDLNGNGATEPGEFANQATDLPAFLPAETIKDYGFYSQVAYGFRKGWVAALRGDYVFPDGQTEYEEILGPDLDRTSRWRIAPSLTYYPSEFSKIRLQYNFDHRNQFGDDHSVWLQFEFLLGSHAAHKF